ncbi:hypothetical protein ACE6H2_021844 [Prunus campanulata]
MFLLSCKLITFLHRPLFSSHPHLVLGFFFDCERCSLSKCNSCLLFGVVGCFTFHTPSICSCITCVQRM